MCKIKKQKGQNPTDIYVYMKKMSFLNYVYAIT